MKLQNVKWIVVKKHLIYCPVKVNVDFQACAAIYLSWQYNIRNPKFPKESTGWVADAPGGGCRTVVTGDDRGGVRSGDGQVDGDVNIVFVLEARIAVMKQEVSLK